MPPRSSRQPRAPSLLRPARRQGDPLNPLPRQITRRRSRQLQRPLLDLHAPARELAQHRGRHTLDLEQPPPHRAPGHRQPTATPSPLRRAAPPDTPPPPRACAHTARALQAMSSGPPPHGAGLQRPGCGRSRADHRDGADRGREHFGHLEPIVNSALRELDQASVRQRPGTVLADAGYWHKEQMESTVSDGIQVLVPPDSGLRVAERMLPRS